MLEVALVGPYYNGLGRYLAPLQEALTRHGCRVTRFGFRQICFDLDEILANCAELVGGVEWNRFDIINFHYGTYDAEQLLPVLLSGKVTTPVVLTVHSLKYDLFLKLGQPALAAAVTESSRRMDGYVCFTRYAQEHLDSRGPAAVTWMPASHGEVVVPEYQRAEFFRRFGIKFGAPVVTVIGYPCRWKDPDAVLRLALAMPDVQFVFGGPWWLGELNKRGAVLPNIVIVNQELGDHEFVTLLESGVGFLPYREDRSFQGSGVLPNYLVRGVTCVVSDLPPLVEYMSGDPFVVDLSNAEEVQSAILQALLSPRRQYSFAADFCTHARDTVLLYTKVLRGSW